MANLMSLIGLVLLVMASPGIVLATPPTIVLRPGFITKVRCQGRLLISAIGNDELVQLEALPKEIGCAVLLKPKSRSGQTNLYLETSAETVERAVVVERSSDYDK